MNGVLGMAELLLADDDLSNRQRRRVEIIKRSGETLLAMLDQIIAFSRIDGDAFELKSSSLDLRELVRRVQDQFQSKGPGNDVKLALIDDLDDHHRVSGDAQHLEELISTFLKSAAALTNENALRIVVSAKPTVPDHVDIRLAAELTGINHEASKACLAAHARNGDFLSEGRHRVDINLFICLKLAKMLGGSLEMDRLANEMSAFRLSFRLHAASVASPETSKHDDHSISCGHAGPFGQRPTIRNVLVAEDDPDMALLVEDLLDEAGFHATIASDGASVLEMMNRQPFDIVLMDGRLPDMTGFEATEMIRNLPDERSNIPIIALTGEALSGDRERYLSSGMDDYIAKPVNYETLVATIERCRGKPRLDTGDGDRDPANR